MTRGAGDSLRNPERELRVAYDYLVDSEDGTGVGIVDDVVLDESGRVARIEVCGGWFGRRRWTFGVADVVAVSPALRRVVVSDASVARKQASRGWTSDP